MALDERLNPLAQLARPIAIIIQSHPAPQRLVFDAGAVSQPRLVELEHESHLALFIEHRERRHPRAHARQRQQHARARERRQRFPQGPFEQVPGEARRRRDGLGRERPAVPQRSQDQAALAAPLDQLQHPSGAVQAPIGGIVIGAGQGMDPRRAHAERRPERGAQRRQGALVRDAVIGEISGHIGGGSGGRRTVAGKRLKV